MSKKPHEFNSEFMEFWKDYFIKMKISNPTFIVKLGYNAKQFTDTTSCLRFFPSELRSIQGIYIEFVNFKNEFYHKNKRVLYRLAYNPAWEEDISRYVPVKTPAGHTTYVVRIDDLEICSEYYNKKNTPEPILTPTMLGELTETLKLEDLEDGKVSSLTIRDLFCILHKKPLTSKKWLNDLINESNEYN